MPETLSPPSSLPLMALRPIILTTGPFLFIWSLLRQYTSKNGPLPFASIISSLHSQAYALFSLLLSYLLVQSYLLSSRTSPSMPLQIPLPFNLTIPFLDRSTLTLDEVAYIYHLSKFYQYLDVLIVVAQGKVVNQHVAFKHVSMPFLTHFRILNCAGGDWQYFALADTMHNTLAYAYHGGVEALKWPSIVMGWVQLGVGVGVDATWMYVTRAGRELGSISGGGDAKGDDEATNRGIAILLLLRYGMLYFEELKGESKEGGKEAGKQTTEEEGKERKEVKVDEKSKKKRR